MAQGKYAEAIEQLEPLAATSSPTQPQLWHTLALAQLGAKQFEPALATLEPMREKAFVGSVDEVEQRLRSLAA